MGKFGGAEAHMINPNLPSELQIQVLMSCVNHNSN